MQVGETADSGAQTLVAQDPAEAEERVQKTGAGAPGRREPNQRARHSAGARSLPAAPDKNVCIKQFRQTVLQCHRDEGNIEYLGEIKKNKKK